ncbi:ABC transporter permease [Planosporangium thailandense]|uniref:ABC transporter permease n=1 Tax=Planosporangium thailandense TaxID=765197 RepID=A0ABX0Y3N1_9ACTN|nr:ABC transporter permease [Planosporangium thailandense]NJC72958.1 ABC transporter permease [Planosporangium thailandense]
MRWASRLKDADRMFLIGALLLALIVLASALAPILSSFDPVRGTSPPMRAPSAGHLFGTDNLGRDVFVRAFAATRLDMMLAVVAVGVSLIVGTLVGAVMGMGGRSKVSGFLNLVVDSINAFPFIVLALGVVAVVGPSVPGVLSAIILTGWARYARVARARTAVIADADFVNAARLLGYGRSRVMIRHVFPNVYSESFAFALSELVIVILAIASLSFLGAGVRPPTPELGAMISEGRIMLTRAWWISVFPGAVLALAALSIQLIADGYERMTRYA